MKKQNAINVNGTEVILFTNENKEYISITDIAKYRNASEPFAVINNWIRTRSAIDFLGLWEKINNPAFKPLEFERFKSEAGANYFVLSPKALYWSKHPLRPNMMEASASDKKENRCQGCSNPRLAIGVRSMRSA